jgi:DTW domain-containing protein YfiP
MQGETMANLTTCIIVLCFWFSPCESFRCLQSGFPGGRHKPACCNTGDSWSAQITSRYHSRCRRTGACLQSLRNDLSLESENAVRRYKEKITKFSHPPDPACPICFLPIRLCVCKTCDDSEVEPSSTPPRQISVLLYMHIREFARRSNTGMLAARAAPHVDVIPLISAHPEHEALLLKTIEERSGRICALYPSPNGSMPLSEWAQGIPQEETVSIILIEGTWDQARRMEKKLPPDVQRVVIESGEKVCSLEALIFALRVLWGDVRGAHVIEMLRSMLLAKANALRVFHGRENHTDSRQAFDQDSGCDSRGEASGQSQRKRRFSRILGLQKDKLT